jgi:hypothetical protein
MNDGMNDAMNDTRPEGFRRVAAALAAGFERRGSIPGYFGDDDAAMLFLRRPVNG